MKKRKRNKFSIEEKERIVLSVLEKGFDSYHFNFIGMFKRIRVTADPDL